MRILVAILFFFGLLTELPAQKDSMHPVDTLPGNHFLLRPVERNGESLPEVDIKEVVIIGRESTSKKFPFYKYQRLVFNLKKVYPYAQVVKARLAEANYELMRLPDEKERKKYLRKFEKELFGEYEDDVRGMTITQGKLLIKLIDRETYNTSYDLIRDYKGAFSAAFWQGIARIFGSNLKAEYDPYGEDAIVEIILMEIEAGNL